MPVTVRGLRELSAAFALADRQTRLGLRQELREVAEPIRRDAEAFALGRIRRMTPRWARMRTGVTRTVVYVAPRERGVRVRGSPRRRPNLADLMMGRALQPALERHQPELEREVERMLDDIADRFNRGGPQL